MWILFGSVLIFLGGEGLIRDIVSIFWKGAIIRF